MFCQKKKQEKTETVIGMVLSCRAEEKLNCSDRSSFDLCIKQLPPILDQAELKGIPSSKRDVENACQAFKLGMGCMDAYSGQCLKERERRIYETQVAGARNTFKFLCDDPAFQSEYLMYTQCYRGISKDWDACASKFIALVREEMARKNVTIESRTVELCCAKHGFLRCVYLAGWLKCRKEEAIFISRMADTLSNIRVYSTRCASLDTNICTNSAKNTDPVSMPVVLSILIIWYILS